MPENSNNERRREEDETRRRRDVQSQIKGEEQSNPTRRVVQLLQTKEEHSNADHGAITVGDKCYRYSNELEDIVICEPKPSLNRVTENVVVIVTGKWEAKVEIVTFKSEFEISVWIRDWLQKNNKDFSIQKFSSEFIEWLTYNDYKVVKLGITATTTTSSSTVNIWAIQVVGTWYEIDTPSKTYRDNVLLKKSVFEVAPGKVEEWEQQEVLGATLKSDIEIRAWGKNWLELNPYYRHYPLMNDICQKILSEFIDWLIGRVVKLNTDSISIEMPTVTLGEAHKITRYIKCPENMIMKHRVYEVTSSRAGRFGREVVGTTFKSDTDIDAWIERWRGRNKDNYQKFVFEFMTWLPDSDYKRVVKLGRKLLRVPVAHHWAIQVHAIWYEIVGPPVEDMFSGNEIRGLAGDAAASGAGSFGGEVVGITFKSDTVIIGWIYEWLDRNPTYSLLAINCQTFSFQFMMWLTDNNYRMEHRVDAGNIETHENEFWTNNGFAAEKNGNAVLSYGMGQSHHSVGLVNSKLKVGQFTAQAVAGPGLGLFTDAIFADASLSAGNVIGVHAGLNANTGIGIRNGNAELHLLGFGWKVGADGVEINTPIAGVNVCSLM